METSSTNRLTKLQVMKLLISLTLPLAVAIFTIITTIENSRIARENREQDLLQTEDEQRQNVFVNYINDISQYRDEYFQNLTNDSQRLLYIRTKTLTALRKLDHERKKQILLFLKENSLLSEDDQSLLNGVNFNNVNLSRAMFSHSAMQMKNHGVFETQHIDCPANTRLICEHRFSILPYTQSASIDTIFERISYSFMNQ